jgi:hypothetical protein
VENARQIRAVRPRHRRRRQVMPTDVRPIQIRNNERRAVCSARNRACELCL